MLSLINNSKAFSVFGLSVRVSWYRLKLIEDVAGTPLWKSEIICSVGILKPAARIELVLFFINALHIRLSFLVMLSHVWRVFPVNALISLQE
jgi:hypothetical protein